MLPMRRRNLIPVLRRTTLAPMREKPKDQETLPRPLVRGTWVRIAQSAQGHKVGKSLIEAVCGKALEPKYHEWVVEDLRKASHCGRCNGKDFTVAPDDGSL